MKYRFINIHVILQVSFTKDQTLSIFASPILCMASQKHNTVWKAQNFPVSDDFKKCWVLG